MSLSVGTTVLHSSLGQGKVLFLEGDVAFVRFEKGVEGCPVGSLIPLLSATERLRSGEVQPTLPTVLRAVALAIRSVNDSWGVFSCSRVQLLPHQLWVCQQVLATWPTAWLVADDVGLGKTIEAGLILTPLLSSGRVKRLLILAPASLTGQWQDRLRRLFDIRTQVYTQEADTPKAQWWSTAQLVVASAHTLRMDKNGRWRRILEAEPWDMVMVDEAHHLHRGKQSDSLGYRLVLQLAEAHKAKSMVFFTGTPHRGDDRAFLSLLALLRPDLINPKLPVGSQLPRLRSVMIRNNKARVTDMEGKPLFKPVCSRFEEVYHQPAEATFYAELTHFIRSGEAYASHLTRIQAQAVELVLTAMQKLASSSVAAIARAIEGRVERLERAVVASDALMQEAARIAEGGTQFEEDSERVNRITEQLAVATQNFSLSPEELPALRHLLALAAEVREESKLTLTMGLLSGEFADRSVLLFTEYKATQAMLFAAIEERFGPGSVTFINGEGRLHGLPGQPGREVRTDRESASERFRRGKVRFLISTEAAGEGVDLQDSCHTLIHYDLPWNPMRMHQRVGRLYRYGQTHAVEVVSIRNPDTVEDHIWSLLDEKLRRITHAFVGGMDDPEDMRQIVLGLSPASEIDRVFAEARKQSPDRLSTWFDARTAQLGGLDAVDAVRQVFGSVARFDFGTVGHQLPRVDLGHLEPFLRGALRLESRRVEQGPDGRLTFLTPRAWQESEFGVAERYQGVTFNRVLRAKDGETVDLMGCGHRLFDVALRTFENKQETLACVVDLEFPIFVFLLRDAVTLEQGGPRRAVAGIRWEPTAHILLRDWELVCALNPILERGISPVAVGHPAYVGSDTLAADADAEMLRLLPSLGLPFQAPRSDLIIALLPGRR